MEEYTYIGQRASVNSAHGKEMKRMNMKLNAFDEQDISYSNFAFSRKRKEYNQYVLPVLTCGLKTWCLIKSLERNHRRVKGGEKKTGHDVKIRLRIKELAKVKHIVMTIKQIGS